MREIMTRDAKSLVALALMAGLLTTTNRAMAADEVKAEEIVNKMGSVVDNLGRKKTGDPVQWEQKVIVNDLDDLIASLEKECQNCKNGIKKNRPDKGMADSTISSGIGGIGDLTNAGDGGKDWGKLSDRERDRILQSMSEGFPPEYRTVLERYYRRLAEEKSAKTKETAKPAAQAKP
jgi:hypothetical protein